MMWDSMDGSWAVWGVIMMIAFWGAVIAVAVWAIESFRPRYNETRGETPLDIARRRYAAGEISREEFEQIRRDLGVPRGNPV
ncbi:MAG: SHOCT domain-containing protein [Chloroflexota bacterium]